MLTGQSLGAYRILEKLGEGGMGEVYRARDTRLARDVAIKILPPIFAGDPDRLARFEREARALAALNHPHIAQIHGIIDAPGDAGTLNALVMELVEGEDLSQRLARGAVPLVEALPIALQMAEALAAAHDQGIIHRDLKPANVKVRDDGTVKVLDFGLAKLAAVEPGGAADPTRSPTITSPATALGVILGTAAYMAPEQAKGQPVDRRADVWAFGALLYEMLTGRRAFPGEDVSDTLASILTRDPDWSALPAATPQAVRRLLRRCLEKDRKRRLADLSDARLDIEEALSPSQGGDVVPATAVRPPWTWRTAVVILTVALVFGLAGAFVSRALTPAPAPAPVTRFFVPLPEGHSFVGEAGGLALSPDGSELVYATLTGLYRRRADALDVVRIEGIDALPGISLEPAYSPDGEWLAFWSTRDQSIKKIPAAGGVPVTVAAAAGFAGMSWGEDGILVARQSGAIERLPVDGGAPEVLVQAPQGQTPASPEMLPRGAGIMYTLGEQADADDVHVVVQQPGSETRTTILTNASQARYLPSGHIVYAVAGTLFVVPFDLDRLEVTGTPVRAADGVRRGFPRRVTNYAVSRSGSLAYVPAGSGGDAAFELALLDRKGGVERLPLPPANYVIPRVSPDGLFAAFGTADGTRDSVIWVYELSGASAARRLTFGDRSRYPTWSHDSRRVIFQSNREGDSGLFWQQADGAGAAERLTRAAEGSLHFADAASPDGRYLLVQIGGPLHVLSLADGSLAPFGGVTSAWSIGATFSPNGRWVAYAVKPDLRTSAAVYVQPFPATGAVYQISSGDEAYHPMWSRDGTELFFVSAPNHLFVTRVTTDRGFAFSAPVPAEVAPRAGPSSLPRFHDILPDGRLISVVPAARTGAAGPGGIHVVLNWTSELQRD